METNEIIPTDINKTVSHKRQISEEFDNGIFLDIKLAKPSISSDPQKQLVEKRVYRPPSPSTATYVSVSQPAIQGNTPGTRLRGYMAPFPTHQGSQHPPFNYRPKSPTNSFPIAPSPPSYRTVGEEPSYTPVTASYGQPPPRSLGGGVGPRYRPKQPTPHLPPQQYRSISNNRPPLHYGEAQPSYRPTHSRPRPSLSPPTKKLNDDYINNKVHDPNYKKHLQDYHNAKAEGFKKAHPYTTIIPKVKKETPDNNTEVVRRGSSSNGGGGGLSHTVKSYLPPYFSPVQTYIPETGSPKSTAGKPANNLNLNQNV